MPTFVREREVVQANQWLGDWTGFMRWLDELEVAGRFVVPFGKLPPVRLVERRPTAPLVVDQPGGRCSCQLKDWVVLDEIIGAFTVCGEDFFKAHYKEQEPAIDTSTPDVENDGELLQRLGTDGMKWAEEFMKLHGKQLDRDQWFDLLHGWFANAIEAGRSAGYSRGQDEAIRDQAHKG